MYNIGLIHETITNEVSSNLNNKELFKDYVKLIKENESLSELHNLYLTFEHYILDDTTDDVELNVTITELFNRIAKLDGKLLKEGFTKINKLTKDLTVPSDYENKQLHESITKVAFSENISIKDKVNNLKIIGESISRNTISEDTNNDIYNQELLTTILVDTFNDTYDGKLTESEKNLFNIIISDDDSLKLNTLENLMNETIEDLSTHYDEASLEEQNAILKGKNSILEKKSNIKSIVSNRELFIETAMKLLKYKNSTK